MHGPGTGRMSFIFLGRKVPCWKRTVAIAIYDFSTSVLRSRVVSGLESFSRDTDTILPMPSSSSFHPLPCPPDFLGLIYPFFCREH